MAEVVYGCKLLVATVLDEETGLPPGETPVSETIETPQQFGVSPQFAEGQRQELRGGDKLIAVVEDDPELVGIDLQFNDAMLNGPAMAIFAHGTWESDKFTPPRVGDHKVPFKAELYVANYAEAAQNASDVDGYIHFEFHYCKGRVPNFTAQDRNFLVPQFTINCRENATADLPIFTWEEVESLPAE